MKIKQLCVLLLLAVQTAWAQHPYESSLNPLGDVLPPSPTASALATYGEIPVSMYTGKANISIPLMGVKSRKLSLPMSLSYYGGGHQVDAISSWVGLGWSLNAGGVITRKVNGIEDDGAGGYWTIPVKPDLNTGGATGHPANAQEAQEVEDYYDYLNKIAEKDWDATPDQFNFNFAGYSGRFFIENDNGTLIPRLIPHQNIKIEFQTSQGSPSTFILTTPDGTTYTFGGVGTNGVKAVETSKTNSSVTCGRNYDLPVITSWYLTSIKSADGTDEITFNYGQNNMSYTSSISEKATKKLYAEGCGCCNQASPATSTIGGLWDHQRCEQRLDLEGVFLQNITSVGQYIVFRSNVQRADLPGGRRLYKISYYDNSNNLVKSVDLTQDYFETTGSIASSAPDWNKRLRLTEVTEKNAVGDANPPYTIEYNAQELPPRLSNAKDYWGFYNGQHGNTTLIPAELPNNPFFYSRGGNRLPNVNYSKAGALEKINYPTGGYAALEYEAHELRYDTPLDETNQKATAALAEYDYPTSGPQVSSTTFTIGRTQEVDVEVKIYNKCGAPSATVSYLKIEEKINGIWYPLTTTNSNIKQSGSGNDGKGTIRLLGIHPTDDIFSLYENEFKLELPAGEYKIIAGAMNSCPDPNSSATLNDRLDISVQYLEYTGNYIYNREVGGLRIKKTTLHDGLDASRDIITEYTYQTKVDPLKSSGYAPKPSAYAQTNTIFFPVYQNGGCSLNPTISTTQQDFPQCICSQKIQYLLSESQIPLHGLSGSHIAYREVTQLKGTNGANGKIWNRFSQGENSSANGGGNLIVPQSILDWRGGNLLEQIIYKNVGGSFVTVKSTVNDYQISSTAEENSLGSFQGLAVNLKGHERDWINPDRVYITCDNDNTGSNGEVQLSDGTTWYSPCYSHDPGDYVIDWPIFGRFNYVYYPIYYGWERPTQSTVKQYDENGVDYVETVTEYDYDNVTTNLWRTKTTNSDGTVHISESKYPTDYTIASSPAPTDPMVLALQKMQELHQHAIPIEQKKYIQKPAGSWQLVGGIFTTFEVDPNNANAVNPVDIYRSELATPAAPNPSTLIDANNNFVYGSFYTPYGVYTAHNENGLPLGFQKDRDIINSFVWGYDNRAPIMKGTHAHHTELAYTSFEGGDEAGWDLQGVTVGNGKIGNFARQTNQQFPVGQVFAVDGQEKAYKFSAWVKTSSNNTAYMVLRTSARGDGATYPNVTGNYYQVGFSNTNGEWQLVEVEIDLKAIRLASGIAANDLLDIHAYFSNPSQLTFEIDAVRFHPVDAFVETYDYDQNTLLPIAMEGVNRTHTSYHFDDFQRLSYVKDFEGNIVMANDYHYKGTGSIENHVATRAVRVPGKTTLAALNGLPLAELTESFQYVDGLGRGLQEVGKGQSPNGKDMVSFMDYDAYGRQNKAYLPYANNSTTGNFTNNPIAQAQTFYSSTIAPESQSSYPYVETIFEASPLNRPKEQSSVGDGWQVGAGHTTLYAYNSNAANTVLKLDGATVGAQYYPAHSLLKSEITDTKGVPSISYIDKLGRVVLVQQELTAGTWTNTYTLYNDFGNVKAVIPPSAVELMVQSNNYDYTDLPYRDLVYTYTYDKRQRLLSKKIPDQAIMFYVYDRLDRVVASQDGKQRANNQWLVQKYDVYGRPALTALYTFNSTIADLQNYFDNQTQMGETPIAGSVGYSNILPPLAPSDEILTINYYDNYDFDRDGQQDIENNFLVEPGYASTYFDRVHGQATGSKTRVLSNTGNFLREVVFYDDRGRVIETKAQNHLAGEELSFNAFDFIGQLTKTKYKHSSNDEGVYRGVTTEENFEYDHTGRLLKVYHQVDNQAPILLSEQHYDEIGRLIQKQLRGDATETSFLQSVDYHYNIKNWLVRINDLYPNTPPSIGNDDLFSMNFSYDYGGNINHLEWQVASYDYRGMYDYSYDQLNRLTNADYKEYLDASTPGNPLYQRQGHYSVNNITYDIMGNITGLQRKGTIAVSGTTLTNGLLDQLSYTYDGNQLKAVEDAGSPTEGFVNGASSATEYVYDVNGNVILDDNKGIEVAYNHLNLPTSINFTGGEQLSWLYSATGQKLTKTATDASSNTTRKQYVGKVQYLGTEIEFLNHPEGRLVPTIVGYNIEGEPIYAYQYEFALQDHLGNNRVFFADNNGNGVIEVTQGGRSNELIQQEHYYPFGMNIKGQWKFVHPQVGGVNQYQYNGKELNDDFGLNWNDYGARWYDASIGRWGAVDPLAEKYVGWSAYNYVMGNPLSFIDPDGMAPSYPIYGKNGKLVGYVVEPGQGPTQIAEDLNENYLDEMQGYISWTQIVHDNSEQFANVFDENGDIKDEYDGAYRSGNIQPDNVLYINYGVEPEFEPSVQLQIQREAIRVLRARVAELTEIEATATLRMEAYLLTKEVDRRVAGGVSKIGEGIVGANAGASSSAARNERDATNARNSRVAIEALLEDMQRSANEREDIEREEQNVAPRVQPEEQQNP